MREEIGLCHSAITESPSYATVNDNEDYRYDLRYQYTGDFFLNDAHITYEDSQFSPRPVDSDGNGYQLFNGGFDNNNTVFTYGVGNVFDDRSAERLGIPGRSDFQFIRIGRVSHDQDRREIQDGQARR